MSSKNHILSCCMDYQSRIKDVGGLVVLFTGDIHLSCIATSSRVHCLNRKVHNSSIFLRVFILSNVLDSLV